MTLTLIWHAIRRPSQMYAVITFCKTFIILCIHSTCSILYSYSSHVLPFLVGPTGHDFESRPLSSEFCCQCLMILQSYLANHYLHKAAPKRLAIWFWISVHVLKNTFTKQGVACLDYSSWWSAIFPSWPKYNQDSYTNDHKLLGETVCPEILNDTCCIML